MRKITRQVAIKLIYTRASSRGYDYNSLHEYLGDKYSIAHLKDACPYDLKRILQGFGVFVIVTQHPMISLCFKRAEEAGLSRESVHVIAVNRFNCSSIYTTIEWAYHDGQYDADVTKLKGVIFKVINYIKAKNEKEKINEN